MELRLREIRKLRNKTQSDIGNAVGVSMRVVSGWERKETEITLVDAARVADVLECTLDELAGRDFHPEASSVAPKLTDEEREILDAYNAVDAPARRRIARAAQGELDDMEDEAKKETRGA